MAAHTVYVPGVNFNGYLEQGNTWPSGLSTITSVKGTTGASTMGSSMLAGQGYYTSGPYIYSLDQLAVKFDNLAGYVPSTGTITSVRLIVNLVPTAPSGGVIRNPFYLDGFVSNSVDYTQSANVSAILNSSPSLSSVLPAFDQAYVAPESSTIAYLTLATLPSRTDTLSFLLYSDDQALGNSPFPSGGVSTTSYRSFANVSSYSLEVTYDGPIIDKSEIDFVGAQRGSYGYRYLSPPNTTTYSTSISSGEQVLGDIVYFASGASNHFTTNGFMWYNLASLDPTKITSASLKLNISTPYTYSADYYSYPSDTGLAFDVSVNTIPYNTPVDANNAMHTSYTRLASIAARSLPSGADNFTISSPDLLSYIRANAGGVARFMILCGNPSSGWSTIHEGAYSGSPRPPVLSLTYSTGNGEDITITITDNGSTIHQSSDPMSLPSEAGVVLLRSIDSIAPSVADNQAVLHKEVDSYDVSFVNEQWSPISPTWSQNDALSLSVSESQKVSFLIHGSDALTIAVSETGSETEGRIGSDTLTLSVTEAVHPQVSMTIADAISLAVSEQGGVSSTIHPATDSLSGLLIEGAGIIRQSSDSLSLSVSDVMSNITRIIVAPFSINIENNVQIVSRTADSGLDLILYPNDNDIDEAIAGHGHGDVKSRDALYKVTQNGQILADLSNKVIGGNITATRLQTIGKTAAFTLQDLDGLDLKTEFLMPVIVWNVNGIDVEFPQGIFQATVPGHNYTEKDATRVDLVANDLSIFLAENFSYPFTVPAGTNYRSGILAVLAITKLKNAAVDIPPTSYVLPNDMTWEAGTAYITAVNDLLQGIAFVPAYVSRVGKLTSRARNFLYQRTPDVTYGSDIGTQIVLEPFVTTINQGDWKNEVIIQVNDPARPAFQSTYYIENPLSPVVLPPRYALDGFSSLNYWKAPALTSQSFINASQGLNAFTANEQIGAVSCGGWVYVDNSSTNQVFGGCWEGPGKLAFRLLSAGTNVARARFEVSLDGTSTPGLFDTNVFPTTIPYTAIAAEDIVGVAPGWHHIVGVYSPGTPIGQDLATGGDFEAGGTSPGIGWVVAQGVYETVTTSYVGGNSTPYAVRVAYTGRPASPGAPAAGITQDIPLTLQQAQDPNYWFTVGFDYEVISYDTVHMSCTAYAINAAGSILGIAGTVDLPSNVAGWHSTQLTFNAGQFPSLGLGTPTAMRIVFGVKGTPATSHFLTFDLDKVTIKPSRTANCALYIDGQRRGISGSFTNLWPPMKANTGALTIGYTPAGGNPNASRIHDFAVWYAELKDTDVTDLYGGIWPANVPFCIGYWRRDGLAVEPLLDLTSHAFTLYPQGNPTVSEITDFPVSAGTRDRFRALPDVINLPRTVDMAVAAQSAQIIAEEDSSSYLSASLNTTLDPRRDLQEMYYMRIIDVHGATVTDGKWVVDSWTMDLKNAGRMVHTIRQVEAF